jgi:hypothetical protein
MRRQADCRLNAVQYSQQEETCYPLHPSILDENVLSELAERGQALYNEKLKRTDQS